MVSMAVEFLIMPVSDRMAIREVHACQLKAYNVITGSLGMALPRLQNTGVMVTEQSQSCYYSSLKHRKPPVSTVDWLPSRLGPNIPSGIVSQPKVSMKLCMGRCVLVGVDAYSHLESSNTFLDSRPDTANLARNPA